MGNIEFYNTMMGKRFYEGTMPELVKTIKALNETVKDLSRQVEELKSELAETTKAINNNTLL